MRYKLKHLTFSSKHSSSRTGHWHHWESGLISATMKNWLRSWLSIFLLLPRKIGPSQLSLAMNDSFSIHVWNCIPREHWRSGIWEKLPLRHHLLESFTNYDRKTRATQTLALHTDFSSMCSYCMFQRLAVSNQHFKLACEESKRAWQLYFTQLSRHLVRTCRRFRLQPWAPSHPHFLSHLLI